MAVRKKNPTVSVLVPVYNEEKTVGVILRKLLALKFVTEIIVVNDCSGDNTLATIASIKSARIKVFSLERNSGKTAAIRRAVQEANGDILIIQDADLEYDPEEIETVIDPIRRGIADVVYGSRFLVKKTARVLYYYHYIANKFLTTLSNILTNLNMTDIETCYKAFKSPVLKHMELTSRGFGMEVEITALISKLPLRIYEVPISYYGRTYEEGKKIGMKDGLLAIWYILCFNIFSRFSARRRQYFDRVRAELSDPNN